MLILIADAFDEAMPKRLARFGEVTSDTGRIDDAEVVLVRSKTKVNRDFIDKAKQLQLVIRGGVGMDTIDMDYCSEKGIIAKNTAEASTVAVAELAFAMMIAMPNHITAADYAVHDGKWPKSEFTRTELSGKTLSILGLGKIGTALAMRARAFRMRVIGWKPLSIFSEFAEMRDTIEEAVAEADYISMHFPLLPETKGLVNAALLAKCKRGVYLINTARGECINETDVVAALESGQLGGYAADVFAQEPPVGSALLKSPRTLLLPHLGASTKENMQRIGTVVEHLLEEYIQHKPR